MGGPVKKREREERGEEKRSREAVTSRRGGRERQPGCLGSAPRRLGEREREREPRE